MRARFFTALAGLLASAGLAAAAAAPCNPCGPQPIQEASPPACSCSCACPCPCPPPPRAWLSADYLLWWVKGAPVPVPLVTTSPFDPTLPVQPVPGPGVLGNSTTSVLYGGSSANFGALSGLRLQGGLALDAERLFALEAGGFFLEQRSSAFSVSSSAAGVPLLALPSFGPDVNGETAVLISRATDFAGQNGGFAGGITVNNSLRLWGSEANLSACLWDTGSFKATGLAGFRYLDLSEALAINASTRQLDFPLPGGFQNLDINPGEFVLTNDTFQTRNQFYGGQVGGRFEYNRGGLSIEMTSKVALGSTTQKVSIAGSSTFLPQGQAPVFVPAGVYAVASNSGTQHGSAFTVVPEVGLTVGYQITSWLRAGAGYSFLYWSSVARPGDQIDRNVDGRQVPLLSPVTPGTTFSQPAARLERSDFWAHGVNFSLAVRF